MSHKEEQDQTTHTSPRIVLQFVVERTLVIALFGELLLLNSVFAFISADMEESDELILCLFYAMITK